MLILSKAAGGNPDQPNDQCELNSHAIEVAVQSTSLGDVNGRSTPKKILEDEQSRMLPRND
jgi:hypothetical protein